MYEDDNDHEEDLHFLVIFLCMFEHFGGWRWWSSAGPYNIFVKRFHLPHSSQAVFCRALPYLPNPIHDVQQQTTRTKTTDLRQVSHHGHCPRCDTTCMFRTCGVWVGTNDIKKTMKNTAWEPKTVDTNWKMEVGVRMRKRSYWWPNNVLPMTKRFGFGWVHVTEENAGMSSPNGLDSKLKPS